MLIVSIFRKLDLALSKLPLTCWHILIRSWWASFSTSFAGSSSITIYTSELRCNCQVLYNIIKYLILQQISWQSTKNKSDKVFSMDALLNKTLRRENKIRIHRSLLDLLDSQFIDQIMCPKTPNIWLNTQIFPDEEGRFYGSGSDPDPDPIRSVPLCIVVFIPALPTAAGVHPSPSSGLYPVTLRRYCDLHQSTTFAYFLIVIAVFQSRKLTPFSPVRAAGFASFRFGGNVWASLI